MAFINQLCSVQSVQSQSHMPVSVLLLHINMIHVHSKEIAACTQISHDTPSGFRIHYVS